jgi:hypothetical protein
MDIRRFSGQLLTDDENFPVIFPVSREFAEQPMKGTPAV